MRKSVWLSLIAALGTMILLYFIGFVANIDMLVFDVSHTYTEISLLPIVAGLFVAFMGDRLMKSKVQ